MTLFRNTYREFTTKEDNNSINNESMSGVNRSTDYSYSKFEFEIDVNYEKTLGAIARKGSNVTVEIPTALNGNITLTITTGVAGTTTITVPSTTGLVVGKFIKFGHNKLYLISEITNSTTFEVYPKLRSTVSGDSIVSAPMTIDCKVFSTLSYNYTSDKIIEGRVYKVRELL